MFKKCFESSRFRLLYEVISDVGWDKNNARAPQLSSISNHISSFFLHSSMYWAHFLKIINHCNLGLLIWLSGRMLACLPSRSTILGLVPSTIEV